MNSAVITYCGHFFHGNCLRKWLYVQETCPMCHQTVRRMAPGQGPAGSGRGPADPPQVDAGPDPAAQQGEQRDPESETANGTPSANLEGAWSESEDLPSDPDSEADGDRSSGSELDVLPVSSVGSAGSQNQLGRPSPNRHSQLEANGTDSSSWTNVGAVSDNPSAYEPTGRHSFALHPNEDGKSKQSQPGVSLRPLEGKYGDENQKLVSGDGSPVGAQTSLESCNQIRDSVNKRLGLCTYSQLERLSQGEPVSQIHQPSSSGTTESTVTDCSPSVP